MDIKCIRVLRPYNDEKEEDRTIYIEDRAREDLTANWGDEIQILGRKKVIARIQPLKDMDKDGLIGRAGQDLIDELYIEYGEEVLLDRL